jgi:hypothetical protein
MLEFSYYWLPKSENYPSKRAIFNKANSLSPPKGKFSANLRNHFAEFNPQIKNRPAEGRTETEKENLAANQGGEAPLNPKKRRRAKRKGLGGRNFCPPYFFLPCQQKKTLRTSTTAEK